MVGDKYKPSVSFCPRAGFSTAGPTSLSYPSLLCHALVAQVALYYPSLLCHWLSYPLLCSGAMLSHYSMPPCLTIMPCHYAMPPVALCFATAVLCQWRCALPLFYATMLCHYGALPVAVAAADGQRPHALLLYPMLHLHWAQFNPCCTAVHCMHQRHVPGTRCRTVQATQCQCTVSASSTTSSHAGQITGTPAPSQGGEDR